MRTIKFRGKTMGGHYEYGLLVQKKLRNSGETVWAIAKSPRQSTFIPVLENTIAQLVGYDSKGKEIYTGDTLIFDDKEYIVPQYEPPRFYSLSEVKHEGD